MTAGPFLVDAMLGRLAVYLRMCGIDAAYALDRDVEADDALLAVAAAEDRRLITRDVALAERAADSILVRSRDVQDQLRELETAGVALAVADPPTRCGACNGRLEAVPAGAPTPSTVPHVGERAVWRCTACDQHFWRGSHWDDVRATLAGL